MVLIPVLKVNFLGISFIIVVAVWDNPVCAFRSLKTLTLEFNLSTFNTLTSSSPKKPVVKIPAKRNLSFSFIAGYCRFPFTERYVTIPVTPSVPIATDKESWFVLIPTL